VGKGRGAPAGFGEGVMALLYPRVALSDLPAMFRQATIGGLVAGCYGVVHDQITYSISQEYFTRFKFAQFHFADFGFPTRVFVAEIGFLATWWVGFLVAWFMARLTVPTFPRALAFRLNLRGFILLLAFAVGAGAIGYGLGLCHGADYAAWDGWKARLGVLDLPSFVRVAYVHNASYLGGLVGLVAALLYLRKAKQRSLAGQSAGARPA
jgi:hypothetical protein